MKEKLIINGSIIIIQLPVNHQRLDIAMLVQAVLLERLLPCACSSTDVELNLETPTFMHVLSVNSTDQFAIVVVSDSRSKFATLPFVRANQMSP